MDTVGLLYYMCESHPNSFDGDHKDRGRSQGVEGGADLSDHHSFWDLGPLLSKIGVAGTEIATK